MSNKRVIKIYNEIEEPIYRVDKCRFDMFNSEEFHKDDYEYFEILKGDEERIVITYLPKDKRLTCPSCCERKITMTRAQFGIGHYNDKNRGTEVNYYLKCQCGYERTFHQSYMVRENSEKVENEFVYVDLTDIDVAKLSTD